MNVTSPPRLQSSVHPVPLFLKSLQPPPPALAPRPSFPNVPRSENLEYSARLKLPQTVPRVYRHGIIDDTLRMLGMYDKQDRLTGSVENKGERGLGVGRLHA